MELFLKVLGVGLYIFGLDTEIFVEDENLMTFLLKSVFHDSLLVILLNQKLIILHFNVTQLCNILLFRFLQPFSQLSINFLEPFKFFHQHLIDRLGHKMLLNHFIDVVHFLIIQILVVTHLFKQLVRLQGCYHVQQGLLRTLHKFSYHSA
jgi:hypothetical protein